MISEIWHVRLQVRGFNSCLCAVSLGCGIFHPSLAGQGMRVCLPQVSSNQMTQMYSQFVTFILKLTDTFKAQQSKSNKIPHNRLSKGNVTHTQKKKSLNFAWLSIFSPNQNWKETALKVSVAAIWKLNKLNTHSHTCKSQSKLS